MPQVLMYIYKYIYYYTDETIRTNLALMDRKNKIGISFLI